MEVKNQTKQTNKHKTGSSEFDNIANGFWGRFADGVPCLSIAFNSNGPTFNSVFPVVFVLK